MLFQQESVRDEGCHKATGQQFNAEAVERDQNPGFEASADVEIVTDGESLGEEGEPDYV